MKNLKRKPQDDQEKVELGRGLDPVLTSEVRERQQRAAALVLEWSKEEDDGVWPLVEEEFGLEK